MYKSLKLGNWEIFKLSMSDVWILTSAKLVLEVNVKFFIVEEEISRISKFLKESSSKFAKEGKFLILSSDSLLANSHKGPFFISFKKGMLDSSMTNNLLMF
ncbi:hypothetical protein BpHYR1_030389 [Brachionus plicatilis]|uniref:Uncharacterized protein n=1 Tax=Brachionus plicatilis TaxID=10195 RepID=A0A3M7QP33_BRAPC|nr:hypothetical protein BpHYR1_030389 [Brachionus plicatilis]